MSEVEKKLNIILPDEDIEEFKFQNEKIAVIPYFTVGHIINYMREYISNLYDFDVDKDLPTRYILAEYALMMQILDDNTNVEIEKLDPDKIISSGLWDQIKLKLKGYDQFRNELNRVLELRQTQENLDKSVGMVLDTLSNRVMEFLDKLADMDVEGLKELSTEFTQQLNSLNEKLPGITDTNKPLAKKRKYTKKTVQ